MSGFLIRRAVISEHKELEALRLRASLTNAVDRDALLAHPDAIELPVDQIAADAVFVSERNGAIVGFAALLPKPKGSIEGHQVNVTVEVRYLGCGHTAGDAVVFIPEDRVVATGDLVHGLEPLLFEAYPDEWPATLDRLSALKFDIIVPGHGPVQ